MAKLDLKVKIDPVELGKQGKSHANHFDDFPTGRKEKRHLKSRGRDWGKHDGGKS